MYPNNKVIHTRYKKHLDEHWYVWFEGLPNNGQTGDESILTLQVIDQDDLPDFLGQLINLNMRLVSIQKFQERTNPINATFEIHTRMTKTRKESELVERNN